MSQKKIGIDRAITDILRQIQRLYLTYQQQSVEHENTKQHMQKQQHEIQLMQQLKSLEESLLGLLKNMDTNKKVNETGELLQIKQIFKDILQDVQILLSKPNFPFIQTEYLIEFVRSTRTIVEMLRSNVNSISQTKFMCCGTDGVGKFKATVEKLKFCQARLNILTKLQAKEYRQVLLAPAFELENFQFIRTTLMREWPEVTYKETIKTVQKIQPIKPNRLALANQYIYGINREVNTLAGLKIYQEDAEGDNPVACSYLAQVYREGKIVPKDEQKSMKYLSKAIAKNQPYACYQYGLTLIKGEHRQKGIQPTRLDFQQGLSMIRKATESLNPVPEALVELGKLYEIGKFDTDTHDVFCIDKDSKKAVQCYLKGRQLNSAHASNNLGVFYINNKDLSNLETMVRIKSESEIRSSLEKGLRYLHEATDLGFPEAYYNLGYVYETGILGQVNLTQALLCYYKGGLKGDIPSQLRFSFQLLNQTSIMKQNYSQHYRIAKIWLQNIVYPEKEDLDDFTISKKSNSGHQNSAQRAEAFYYLGLMYQFGFGVQINPKQAFNFYSQATILGWNSAKNKLGDCYFSGFGTNQDKKIAIGCYIQAAASSGSTQAMISLGAIYMKGIKGIIDKNYKQAFQYLSLAAQQQNSNAMLHLSYMYKNGLGMKKDEEMAQQMMQEAGRRHNMNALYILRQQNNKLDYSNNSQLYNTPTNINPKQAINNFRNSKC